MVRCQPCGRSLTGERQKGHIYYRCHTPGCPPTSVREEAIETAIRTRFLPFAFTDVEVAEMRETRRREYERQSTVDGEQDSASALPLKALRTTSPDHPHHKLHGPHDTHPSATTH